MSEWVYRRVFTQGAALSRRIPSLPAAPSAPASPPFSKRRFFITSAARSSRLISGDMRWCFCAVVTSDELVDFGCAEFVLVALCEDKECLEPHNWELPLLIAEAAEVALHCVDGALGEVVLLVEEDAQEVRVCATVLHLSDLLDGCTRVEHRDGALLHDRAHNHSLHQRTVSALRKRRVK